MSRHRRDECTTRVFDIVRSQTNVFAKVPTQCAAFGAATNRRPENYTRDRGNNRLGGVLKCPRKGALCVRHEGCPSNDDSWSFPRNPGHHFQLLGREGQRQGRPSVFEMEGGRLQPDCLARGRGEDTFAAIKSTSVSLPGQAWHPQNLHLESKKKFELRRPELAGLRTSELAGLFQRHRHWYRTCVRQRSSFSDSAKFEFV